MNLKEIPYDIKPINLIKGNGEQHSVEFRKINPLEKVPALCIDNHTFIESVSILGYIYPYHDRFSFIIYNKQHFYNIDEYSTILGGD